MLSGVKLPNDYTGVLIANGRGTASGTDLVCDACQWAHKGCSVGIAYCYCLFANRFHAPLNWARQDPLRSSPVLKRPSDTLLNSLVPLLPLRGMLVLQVVVVFPRGFLVEPCAPGSRSSPHKLGHTGKDSQPSVPPPPPPPRVRVVHGPTIRIPPPAQPLAPPACLPAPSIPLQVGDIVIPPGSDLAHELKVYEATEAQAAAASQAMLLKEWEAAHLAAAATKRCLEAEQRHKDQWAVKEHWKEGVAAGVQHQQSQHSESSTTRSLTSRVAQSRLGMRVTPPTLVVAPPEFPSGAPTTLSPLTALLPPWSPPWFLEHPGLDGAAYHRAHANIASSCDPAVNNLREAYGDSHHLALPHLVCWEPLVKAYKALVVPGYPSSRPKQGLRLGTPPSSYTTCWALANCFINEPVLQKILPVLCTKVTWILSQLGGSYSLDGASKTNALLCVKVEHYCQELSQLSNAFQRLESARPTSFLAEVVLHVEFLV
ncbi:hypothetical protein BT96DRAFT_991441 [Gymnopus androsaceus JB14]|uniref:Uncharacterized protein n=1 Tax=Gymnopus androsaceus JB14 TaxID=1447944 RepID=A0A6A4HUG6_9AGAR|nr:hypothetical protein BT96DRAFT_991441 [Gymnopus androsaceus JB14]